LVSSLLSVVIVVYCAFNGLGVWSLVIYQLVLSLTQTLLLWGTHRWLPSFDFDFHSFKSLFKYGGFLLLSGLFDTIYLNIQGLIIGRKFSPAVMGYYSQAKKLEDVPTSCLSNIVAQVTFPVFSSIKDTSSSLLAAHRKCIQSTNFINMPLMGFLIIVAQPLILLLFSDKWLASVPYFQILCFSGLVNCLQSVNYQLYVAVGYSKSMFKWTIIKNIVGIIFILLGGFWGVNGILWGMVLGFWFSYIVNAILAGRVTGYSIGKQLYELLPVAIITILSCIVAYFVGGMLPSSLHCFFSILIQGVVFLIIYLIGVASLRVPAYYVYKGILQDFIMSMKKKCRK
jgi:O-antigen/teichoic acid export membrane protein